MLPLLVRENDYIFKPSTSRYAMLAMVDVLATELAMANKPRKRQITPYCWRSTATAAASIGSRWGLTLLAEINLSACSRVRSTACPAR